MQSEKLQQLRAYESEKRPEIKAELPVYHLTGGVGWINDPNGFSLYRGEYHLFFQYYPLDVHWGPMHWGHAKTKDFIRWEYLPAALAPDTEADRDGCYSGTAMELPDGRQLLFYTGVRKETGTEGKLKETQLQCVAIGDGRDYVKAAENPVIGETLLPAGGSSRDFRDPKIWLEDGVYHVLVANADDDGDGRLLHYTGRDPLHWEYCGVMAENLGAYGTMWECPDFFVMDGKKVLIHSAHEMLAEGLEFHPGDGTVCHIGEVDADSGRFLDDSVQAVDYGLDFYAPQTLETEDGRRILIAWMQSWESAVHPVRGLRFLGQMTLPRELRIRNGRLCQMPVRELEKYRRNRVSYQDRAVSEMCSLPGICGRVLDMTLQIRLEDGCGHFELTVADNGKYRTRISLLPGTGTIRLDRSCSGVRYDGVHVREFPVTVCGGEVRMRLLLDRYSLELFVNDGEQAASMTLYAPPEADGITFSAEGGTAVLTLEKYDLVGDIYE
ncbi:MAG: GH32 C-terminal domain-containing protein [Oscillospiraceae bacterium]|nr:GH32 C-terminal domain-containing protein [Oscillospiraceae bacterium]